MYFQHAKSIFRGKYRLDIFKIRRVDSRSRMEIYSERRIKLIVLEPVPLGQGYHH